MSLLYKRTPRKEWAAKKYVLGLLVFPVCGFAVSDKDVLCIYRWSFNTSAWVETDIAAFALSGPSTTADRS